MDPADSEPPYSTIPANIQHAQIWFSLPHMLPCILPCMPPCMSPCMLPCTPHHLLTSWNEMWRSYHEIMEVEHIEQIRTELTLRVTEVDQEQNTLSLKFQKTRWREDCRARSRRRANKKDRKNWGVNLNHRPVQKSRGSGSKWPTKRESCGSGKKMQVGDCESAEWPRAMSRLIMLGV